MRVVVVLVKGAPEERADDSGGLNPAKGQLEDPHHVLVGVFGEGDDFGRESVVVLGILLDAETKRVSLGSPTLRAQSMNEVLDESNSHETHAAQELRPCAHGFWRKGTLRYRQRVPPKLYKPATGRPIEATTYPLMQEVVKLIFRQWMLLASVVERILQSHHQQQPWSDHLIKLAELKYRVVEYLDITRSLINHATLIDKMPKHVIIHGELRRTGPEGHRQQGKDNDNSNRNSNQLFNIPGRTSSLLLLVLGRQYE